MLGANRGRRLLGERLQEPPVAGREGTRVTLAGEREHPERRRAVLHAHGEQRLHDEYGRGEGAAKEIGAGEQIVSLARALSDREAESRALLRVGNAQLRLGAGTSPARYATLAVSPSTRRKSPASAWITAIARSTTARPMASTSKTPARAWPMS